MPNAQIPNRATAAQPGRPNLSPMANQLLSNPALIALAAAIGLVIVAALIATIMGIAEQARNANKNRR